MAAALLGSRNRAALSRQLALDGYLRPALVARRRGQVGRRIHGTDDRLHHPRLAESTLGEAGEEVSHVPTAMTPFA